MQKRTLPQRFPEGGRGAAAAMQPGAGRAEGAEGAEKVGEAPLWIFQ